jgi:site-specific DNA recombinase
MLHAAMPSCGCCRGKCGVITKQRYGCLNHRRRVSCSNGRTIQRAIIEERVLAGLTERLVSAEAVAEAVRAYHEETNRQNQARRAQAEADRKALAKIERAIAGIIAAVEDGLYQPTMKARLAELERQKAEIEARLRAAEPELPDVNPNVAELYRRKVRHLAEALAEDPSSQEAAIALRSLIGEVVLTPGEKRGEVNATLRGELMGILDFANDGNAPGTIVITKVAAGPRNQLDLQCSLRWFPFRVLGPYASARMSASSPLNSRASTRAR